ncbi:MAG: glycerol kinase [Tenericutes bacterium HGW-Tenericutes-5]|jgi:glycerol kinase|nr:MAG: glycerol kinase [Tenericutes bacterium HGW-Tenericutes-5]
MGKHILAIDQGTTSSRVIIFNQEGKIVSFHQKEFKQYFPKPGYVLHDAEEIWESVVFCMEKALQKANLAYNDIDAIGITNQRETTVIWDKLTSKPLHKAICWQSSQTKEICDELIELDFQETFKTKTGLLINPYFSGTKIKWLLDNVKEARSLADNNQLAFGTIDSWIIWNLSKGKSHITDYSNASRTLIYNIHELKWDDELLNILTIPRTILPKVVDSSGISAYTDESLFAKKIPISGIAGDQQAALFGQTCFNPGDVKNTYGTGCFLLMNTGNTPKLSQNGLLTTIAWGINGEVEYALEGSIFVAGSAIQWLRDGLGIIETAQETEELARKTKSNLGVYFVPAFVGLGTPYWEEDARGSFFGLTRGVTKMHIVRSALEAICYQTKDVVNLMEKEANIKLSGLKVDGGASKNNFLMEFQSDILNCNISRPSINETTALGACYLAGIGIGLWKKEDVISKWIVDRTFKPNMTENKRNELYHNWQRALRACVAFADKKNY